MTEEALIREDPRGWHPSRHPDNVPGQDPCLQRKMGQNIGEVAMRRRLSADSLEVRLAARGSDARRIIRGSEADCVGK